MLPKQRQAMILDHVRQRGGVSVSALAHELQVSPSTIRRDLNDMDSQGILRRVRGGGMIDADPKPFHVVASTSSEERDLLGKYAADMVSDRQVVLLDIGATVAMVARHLRNRPVTVVTASLAVADELRDSSQTEVIVLGGIMRHSYLSLVGPLTEQALDGLSADIAFLGTSGIRDDLTVLDTTGTEVPIKRLILQKANSSYLLATADKFPGSGMLSVCKATDFSGVITTASPDITPLQKLLTTNTRVETL
ncbi:DeoR/GlpR transcriptional regulator [Actinomycetaceae bacterium WB03_NA08]|uniref:DeoR/GlpR transcriptional regulator n=1 Tax=Scrofimicrobium canadense TaxID=2652290 RepID=A0A6N7W6S3_9ACTO|nr:DeoR/GlpR family DNA-binding transcription regulator [Scrofimicrobium canadense]MSS85081.1 DeoR/GlpR transcriptional regulator [Scrofimicrobium canadense]